MEPEHNEPFNPYQAPTSGSGSAGELAEVQLAAVPCPQCGGHDAQPVPYSKWHGRRAPRAIQEVRCPSCGTEFNGETGVAYPPRSSKVVMFVIALLLFIAYFVLVAMFDSSL